MKQLLGLVRGSHTKAGDSILGAWPARRQENRQDPVRVLAVAEDQELLKMLGEIAKTCNWQLSYVSTVDEAVKKLETDPTRLVIFDHDPSGSDWRIALRRFHVLPNPVCVFLASKVADRYLWDEVIRNHGYDVLPKPLRREEMIRSLELAWYWRVWQQKWAGDRKGR